MTTRRGSNGGEARSNAPAALPDFGTRVLSASAVVAYVAVGAAAILLASAAPGESRPADIDPKAGCKSNPALVGACFTIHGRIMAANGTPGMRIWRVGTKRILGVLPSEDEIVPEPLKEYLKRYFGPLTNIYGDLLVCPFTEPRPGEMQMVCIEAASHLVVEQYGEGQGERRVFRVKE